MYPSTYKPRAIGVLQTDYALAHSSSPYSKNDEQLLSDVVIDDARDLRAHSQSFEIIADIMPITLVSPISQSTHSADAGGSTTWGIRAVGADTSPYTGKGVTVAILDTGIDASHEAFCDPNLRITEKNFSSAPCVQDSNGHGTHCAATLFGRSVDKLRVGVAPGVTEVFIGKVLDDQGEGATDVVVKALDWVDQQQPHIVSMSFGVDFVNFAEQLERIHAMPKPAAISLALQTYVDNLRLFDALCARFAARQRRSGGSLLIAASGNDSVRSSAKAYSIAAGPPASCSEVIAVGAVEPGVNSERFTVAPFSNSGVDVCAPGSCVTSAKLGGGYHDLSGTSMATPHVAGVAALWAEMMLTHHDRVEARQLHALICGQANPLTGYPVEDIGSGMVQSPSPRHVLR